MTIEMMKAIATENNGTIPKGMTMSMTDLEIKRAIKHGFLKEEDAPARAKVQSLELKENTEKKAPEKVQSPEPKKEKDSKKTSGKKAPEKTAKAESNDNENAVINPPASQFSKEQKAEYDQLDGIIYDRMNDMKKSSFDIAFALHIIYENGYYKIGGYKNIYNYARERYGIARGTTNNFINLVDRFGDLKNQKIVELKPEFAAYSSTQLICMLGHTDEELKEKKIVPSMSSREIKKALKDNGNGSKGEDINTLNGGVSSSKSSGKKSGTENEEEETGNESGLNEFRFNVVCDIDRNAVDSLLPASEFDTFEDFVSALLSDKVKVICKLLKSGHSIQIIDILP